MTPLFTILCNPLEVCSLIFIIYFIDLFKYFIYLLTITLRPRLRPRGIKKLSRLCVFQTIFYTYAKHRDRFKS